MIQEDVIFNVTTIFSDFNKPIRSLKEITTDSFSEMKRAAFDASRKIAIDLRHIPRALPIPELPKLLPPPKLPELLPPPPPKLFLPIPSYKPGSLEEKANDICVELYRTIFETSKKIPLRLSPPVIDPLKLPVPITPKLLPPPKDKWDKSIRAEFKEIPSLKLLSPPIIPKPKSFFGKFVEELSEGVNKVKILLDEFHRPIVASSKDLQEMAPQAHKTGDSFGILKNKAFNLGYAFRLNFLGLRKFRMEMLGIMFFGKMMGDALFGLLKPAMDSFGIFDMFSAMLQILFLPVIELISPILFKIMETLMGLNPYLQLFLGIFVLIAAVVMTVAGLIGAFVLGIGSALAAVLAPFIVTGLAIGLVVAAIIVVIKCLWDNWDKIWGKISEIAGKAWSLIVDTLTTFKDKILTFFNFDEIKDKFLKAWEGCSLKKWYDDNIKKYVDAALAAIDRLLVLLHLKEPEPIVMYNVTRPLEYSLSEYDQYGTPIKKGDFIWRPGSSPVSFSPNDTIIGTKGGTGNGVVMNVTYNINVVDKDTLRKEMENHDRKLLDEVSKMVRT